MASLNDPAFRYRPSFDTNLRRTFAQVRSKQRAEARQRALAGVEAPGRVTSIVGKTASNRR